MIRSKKIIGILIVLSFLSFFLIVIPIIVNKKDIKFYEYKINSVVLDSNNFWKRSTSYYLKDDLELVVNNFFDNINIKVGDSLVKIANSHRFIL